MPRLTLKDESADSPIVEWCYLKPKMYSFLKDSDRHKMRAKGVPTAALHATHSFKDYKEVQQAKKSARELEAHATKSSACVITNVVRITSTLSDTLKIALEP